MTELHAVAGGHPCSPLRRTDCMVRSQISAMVSARYKATRKPTTVGSTPNGPLHELHRGSSSARRAQEQPRRQRFHRTRPQAKLTVCRMPLPTLGRIRAVSPMPAILPPAINGRDQRIAGLPRETALPQRPPGASSRLAGFVRSLPSEDGATDRTSQARQSTPSSARAGRSILAKLHRNLKPSGH